MSKLEIQASHESGYTIMRHTEGDDTFEITVLDPDLNLLEKRPPLAKLTLAPGDVQVFAGRGLHQVRIHLAPQMTLDMSRETALGL